MQKLHDLGGACYWCEALLYAEKFIERVKSLSPDVPEQQLQMILSHPRVITRIQETLQRRDVEGSRQELIRSGLGPSTGRGPEGLRVLCSYLEQTLHGLLDASSPVPMVYRH